MSEIVCANCECESMAAIAESKHFFILFISHALKCQNISDGGRLLFVNMYLMCCECVCVCSCSHMECLFEHNDQSTNYERTKYVTRENMSFNLFRYYYFFFCARIFLSRHFPEGTFENCQHAIACHVSVCVYVSPSVLHRAAEAAAADAETATATAHPTENCV